MASDIITGIKNVLTDIFVPTEDYLTARVESIKSNFAFADSVIDTVESLQTSISRSAKTGTAPSITLNLSSKTGKFNYGSSSVKILDMSWYSKYKSQGDTLISGVLWVGFIWNIFTRLPSIIGGASAGAYSLAKIDDFTTKQAEKKKGGSE